MPHPHSSGLFRDGDYKHSHEESESIAAYYQKKLEKLGKPEAGLFGPGGEILPPPAYFTSSSKNMDKL